MDFYSKMPITRRIPPSQCNASRTTSVLKEYFAEHGIPEVLHTDNGPQFTNALFTKFVTDWMFDNNTSSPRNPRSNGQAEEAIKTIKALFTCAKCSGQDPYLALLSYCSMPIDAPLCSPAEMLLPASAMHLYATMNQALWSTCQYWTWPPQPTCCFKCRVPQPVRIL